jgi:UDP-glucose 4-epimerase
MTEGAIITVVEKSLPLVLACRRRNVNVLASDLRYINQKMSYDYVFHLAGVANAAYAEENQLETYESNVIGTCNLLRHVEVKEKFLFTSSAVVYGNPFSPGPIAEETDPKPISIYGATKLAAEELIRTYNRIKGIPYVIARFFNLYGPRQSTSYIIPQIIVGALRDQRISLRNDKVERDFLYISDAIECITQLALLKSPIDVANVGSGKSTSLRELAEAILEIMEDKSIPIETKDSYDSFSAKYLTANIEKISGMGWGPKTSLRSGLSKTINYYRGLVESQNMPDEDLEGL